MKVGLIFSGALAIALASLPTAASATTAVAFNAYAANDEFLTLIPPGATIDDRFVGLQGTITFVNDVVTGTIGLADIASLSVDMTRGVHGVSAPANVYLIANYHFSAANLTDFSLTFVGGQATAGHWSLTPIAPFSFTLPAFSPMSGFDVNSAEDPSITFYQKNGDVKVAFAKADIDNFGAVPEPASWMIMVVGFGAMGITLRGRKRTRVAVVA